MENNIHFPVLDPDISAIKQIKDDRMIKKNLTIHALLAPATFLMCTYSFATAQETTQFSPAYDAGDLENIIVRIEGAESTELPVSDIHFDIVTWDGGAADVLTLPNQAGRDPFTWKFYGAVLVVAGGKLFRDGGGVCSAWENDISVCSVECDGGHFFLKRDFDDNHVQITLNIAPMPNVISGDTSAAIRIGSCGEGGDGDEILLDVTGGNSTTIQFSRFAETD